MQVLTSANVIRVRKESQALSARVAKYYVTIFIKSCNKIFLIIKGFSSMFYITSLNNIGKQNAFRRDCTYNM